MSKDAVVKIAGVAVAAVLAGAAVIKASKSPDRKGISVPAESAEFTYVGTTDNREYKGRICFSDSYFDNPSQQYNPSLATASLAFAMSCGNSPQGFEHGPDNAICLLKDQGFEEIHYNEPYSDKPVIDSIGVIVGKKKIGNSILVAVGIRGIGYGSEWGSNLLLGSGELHQGFDDASEKVIGFVSDYLVNYCNGNIKLWITGYSRSAAIANIVAGKLDQALIDGSSERLVPENCHMGLSDLYAYCFEPPMTADAEAYDLHNRDFLNIWNIVNPNDPVPILVMSCFGMGRFGTDVLLPCSDDKDYAASRDAMLNFYRALPNVAEIGPYRADRFELTNVSSLFSRATSYEFGNSQREFLHEFNRRFASSLGTREFYARYIQSGFSELVAERWADKDELTFKNTLPSCIASHKLDFATAILCLATGDTEGIRVFLKAPVREALEISGSDPSMESDMLNAISETMVLLKDFILENKLLFFNFVIHSKSISTAHYPELIFSWMQGMDPNYR